MTTGSSSARLSNLSIAELQQLLRDERIGDVYRERITEELAVRLGECDECGVRAPKQATPKSTNPRANMTRVEMRMADVLDMRIRSGEVTTWWFECLQFRTGADRSHYRPDFVALLATGRLEVIEVKGPHIFEDSRKSFKAAALMYPFARWRMLQWAEEQWRTVYDFTHDEAVAP